MRTCVVILLILLPHKVLMAHVGKCPILNPQPSFHEYYQPGDVMIGAIASHSFFISSVYDFMENPVLLEHEEFM